MTFDLKDLCVMRDAIIYDSEMLLADESAAIEELLERIEKEIANLQGKQSLEAVGA